MFDLYINDNIITVITDDISAKSFFKYTYESSVFNFKLRRYTKGFSTGYIYDSVQTRNKVSKYKFKLGWGIYLLNIFKYYITPDQKKSILDTIYSSVYRTEPFPNLRNYQNDDVLFLLKYKYGLFSCYTGYGKSETIATLVNYSYSELGKNTLLLVPSIKCKDELVKRCKERFNIDVPSKDGLLNIIVTGGVSNSKKYKDEESLKELQKEFDKVEWVLADEVEYVMSPGGKKVLDMIHNYTNMYGFSGTADKTNGEMISFANGLSPAVTNNSDLVGYFGQSLVHRSPIHLDIDLISIRTSCFNNLKFTEDEMKGDKSIYQTVMNKMWMNPETCNIITQLPNKFPKLFIPINNLSNIISNWIDNYWLGKWRILLISGAGYTYFDKCGNVTNVDLKGACDLIRNDEVDIIPSTSSGYRALDLPGLNNILLIQGVLAGVVLQSIGRVARGTKVNIIDLKPKPYRSIPIYSRGVRERSKMVQEYYKYCSINSITIEESEFNINNISVVHE